MSGLGTVSSSSTGHRLKVVRPSGAKEAVPLGDRAVTIGRAYTNTLVLDETLVSRHHARIEREEDRFVVVDLGSKNGTFVDGERVERHVLEDGDVVIVGETEIKLEGPARPERVSVPVPPAAPPGQGTLLTFCEYVAGCPAEVTALEEVAAQLQSVVACARATILIVEEGTGKPLMQFSYAADPADADGPDDQVIQAALTADRPLTITVPRARQLGTTLGVRHHLLLLPLWVAGRKLGLVAMERDPNLRPFDDDELESASLAGSLVALFLRMVL